MFPQSRTSQGSCWHTGSPGFTWELVRNVNSQAGSATLGLGLTVLEEALPVILMNAGFENRWLREFSVLCVVPLMLLPSFLTAFFPNDLRLGLFVYIPILRKESGVCSGNPPVSLGNLLYFSPQGAPRCLLAKIRLRVIPPRRRWFSSVEPNVSQNSLTTEPSFCGVSRTFSLVSECMKPKKEK